MSQNNTRFVNINENYKTNVEPGLLRELNPNGNWDFAERVSVVGYNPDVNLTFEDVDNTNNNFNYDTSGSQLTITSTSTDDAIGNIGIEILFLEGLDTNYDVITEVAVLTGTTGVVTDNTFLRLKRIRVVSTGSNKTAVGTISITGDSFTWAKIDAGNYTCLLGRYTVPRGYCFIITGINVAVGQKGDFECLLMINSPSLSQQNVSRVLSNNNFLNYTDDPALIPEKTDIWWKAKRDNGGGGDTRLTAGFVGVIFNESKSNNLFR